ncbi:MULTISPECIES: hypothetical protein [unclassified Moorena]|uniref:hypothetical protein n=1 Tax=unclassified Moorena TaxID=2683338 RepID=UPI0013FEB6CD|nr:MULTISPECIES: hypothetical protein [unclassified Moorena]NEO12729.1 hypothetical protein [Moorena sp. SIO3E8]NEP99505.1 hypothetical protein [Moorena sp. SIO3F7]
MKGKLNYLVIVGVSIILLLGIVTTAVAQDNSKFYDTTINFDDGCEKYDVPIYYRNSNHKKPPRKIGCIKLDTSVKIIEDDSKSTHLSSIKIKGNYENHKFLIFNSNLGNCSKGFPEKICKTIPQQLQSSQN